MVAGEPASVGSTLDLPPAAAFMLINSGKAIPATEAPAPAPEVEPEPIKPARTRTKPAPTTED